MATKSHQEHVKEMSRENCQIKEKLGISKERKSGPHYQPSWIWKSLCLLGAVKSN
jgi:hypothetical protein